MTIHKSLCGGVYAIATATPFTSTGSVSLSNNTIMNNSAFSDGGGVYATAITVADGTTTADAGSVSLSNNTIINNSASNGGGVFTTDYAGSVTINNSIFLENTKNGNRSCFKSIGRMLDKCL